MAIKTNLLQGGGAGTDVEREAAGQAAPNWAEENFMEQVIQTPTRGRNILDLVFTNTSELVSGYSTIINRQFLDHNILRVRLNYKYKNEKKAERKNPYP